MSWELPDRGIEVAVRLSGSALSVDFTASATGELTWPVVRGDPGIRGYILPTFEGVYAPADDPEWIGFLAAGGPFSTTELAMPFWGLDRGDYTLTYLLTNPFNNALAFRDDAGRLAASLTHTFPRNQKVKQYGVRITLGPPSPIEPARCYRRWLKERGEFVSLRAKIRRTPEARKLPGAAHIYLWGDGLSVPMLDRFKACGFDRLWLGANAWQPLRDQPEAVRRAKALGYLIGPYDSYNSIHDPDAGPDETWETAQFDRHLYETGPVIQANGRKKPGFQRKGYALSPLAARPAVEARVSRLMREFGCNSWFIDCDAFGELYDDYSPLHPATQADDMKARLARMAWIRDTYGLVIGSEGGSAYAASTIHFAHGMMTPLFGWGDPELKDRASPFYLGGYYPPDAPPIAVKSVPLKSRYYRFYFDPRFRLPLYQTVFHDSVVTTHHAGLSSLKFQDQVVPVALLELLYNVPPLYQMNGREFDRHRRWMQAHYAFFSPLHRQTALLPLTDFAWLTSDRLVQRTVFGGKVEAVANFSPDPFRYPGTTIPGQSILARWRDTGRSRLYTPTPE